MRHYAAIIGILFLATAVYLYRLNVPSYWLDEALSLSMSRDWSLLWERLLDREVNMWLYYIQLHFLQQGSQIEFYTRSFSVGFSILSVALLYSFVLRLFKQRQTALIAALFMAINAFMLRYAQETRGYSEVLFFVLLATYLLVRGQESGQRRWWIAYAFCITLGLYLHLFVVFIAFAHALWLLTLKQKRWGNYLIGGGLSALGLVSLIVFQPIFRSQQVDWIEPFKLQQLEDFAYQLSGSSGALQTLYLFVILLAIMYFIEQRAAANQRLIWLYLLLPIAMTIFISIFLKPFFIVRYLLMTLPAFSIIVALGVSQLSKRWIILTFVALASFISLRSNYYALEDRIQRPHNSIRELTIYLDSFATAEDLIMVQTGHTPYAVLDYYWWRYTIEADFLTYDNSPELINTTPSHIWLLQLASSPLDDTAISSNYQLIATQEFNGLKLWEYALRSESNDD